VTDRAIPPAVLAERQPRVGYVMVIAVACLFAVNGAVSKIVL
jgi:hypothetical protein